MKRIYTSLLPTAAAVAALIVCHPGLAQNNSSRTQNNPTQNDFYQALRPVPSALNRGHSGLPTVGASLPAAPSANLSKASVSLSPSYEQPARKAPVPAVRLATHPRHAGVAAVPQGCAAQAQDDTAEKRSIDFSVPFEFSSAQLKPEALDTLRKLGKALNENLGDQKLFVIEGHTDAIGTLLFNQELSLQRAEAVKQFLVTEEHVAPERLQVVGKAYCNPANPSDPRGAENRRVVVINNAG